MTLPSASTLGGTYWQPQMSAHWSILNECAVMHASYRLYGDEHACASVHGEQPSVVPEILWQSEACCLQSQIMPHLRLSFTSPLRQSA